MINETVMKLLNENAQNKANYLLYLNNMDTIYDIEFVRTLYEIMRLQRDSLNIMIQLLIDKHEYLSTLTFTTKIYIEKYNATEDTFTYFVFPQVTPNIENGDKLTFTRPGQWFGDPDIALAFAEALKLTYGGEIINKIG